MVTSLAVGLTAVGLKVTRAVMAGPRITSSTAYLISWSPLQGYAVDDVIRGPAVTARVTFSPTAVSPTASDVTMLVSCSAGVPVGREVRDT